jgi:hypothetical protein
MNHQQEINVVSWAYADLKRDAPGAILIVALFAAIYILAPSNASSTQAVDQVGATVKSLAWDHTKTYALLLEDSSIVFVQDDRPYLIGSHVAIERVRRDDRSVFYRLPE